MQKVLIFGNSGSGKSTLAKALCNSAVLAHLDLDILAWQDTLPPERKPLIESSEVILNFIQSNDGWVIEGCYTDLLGIAIPYSNEIIFINLPTEECIRNARNRPWEPHKYQSKEAQDANLEMLIDWISQYESREDTFSKQAHDALYESYPGKKRMFLSNKGHR